jgi:hypothetical protein
VAGWLSAGSPFLGLLMPQALKLRVGVGVRSRGGFSSSVGTMGP